MIVCLPPLCSIPQGEPGVSFVLIREGTVSLFQNGENIGEKGPGAHFGEESQTSATARHAA